MMRRSLAQQPMPEQHCYSPGTRNIFRSPRLQVSRPAFVKRNSSLEESAAPNMRMGSRVRHSKFGDGVVLNFEGNGPHARIQVNFEAQGTKWLMLSYANLVRVE